MKNNTRKVALICSAIAVVCIVSGVIFYMMNRPKMILVDTLQKMSNTVLDVFRVDDATSKEDDRYQIQMKGTLTFDSSLGVDPFGLLLKYQTDQELDESLIDLALTSNDTEHLGMNIYLKDQILYYQLREIMDRYYSNPIDLGEDATEESIDHIKYLVEIFLKQVEHHLNQSNVKEKSSTLSIAGEELDVKRISVTFTNSMMKAILKDTVQKIEKDSKAMDIVVNLLNVDNAQDAKEQLDALIEDENSSSEDSDLFTYLVYVKSNTVVGQAIEQDGTQIQVIDYQGDITVSYSENGSDLLRIQFVKDKDTNYQISGSIGGMYDLMGTYENTGEQFNLYLQLSALDQELGSLVIMTSDTDSLTMELNINGLLQTTWSLDYQTIENLDSVDLSNSVDYSTVSDEELEAVGEKLIAKLFAFPPLQNLWNTFSQVSM